MKRGNNKAGLPAKPPSGSGALHDYVRFLEEIKEKVRLAQVNASVSVNSELILLYWSIGRDIVRRQKIADWGDKFVDRLSADLLSEFPGTEGFSRRNLYRMRAFYSAYSGDGDFVPQAVAQIYSRLPWGQNIVLLEKLKDPAIRAWYALKAIENGWNRVVLTAQIDTDLYGRQALPARKATNFPAALPAPQSELAVEMLKDPYIFDFLSLAENARERDLENALMDNLTKFLLELGVGFAFMGRQYRLEVGGQEYFLDLLFYHRHLRCLVVVELKIDDFKPEYAGKMQFYLNAVDDLLRNPEDQPSIGIIMCRSRNKTIVEYALRKMDKPIGVAQYRLTKTLPAALRDELPTVKGLEGAVGKMFSTLPPLEVSPSVMQSMPKLGHGKKK